MARRRDPLVPLSLFRSRTFTTINLATFFIYGALYVTFSYQGILLQNVLGYTALAAGAVGIPVGICLTLLSTRFGAMAGRFGARPFLVAGPLLMAGALLWYARIPVDSDPWLASLAQPATLIPPADVLVDVLPVDPPVRPRHLVHRRPADDLAHGLGLRALLGAGLGDQQRHRARRPAAPRRHRLPRDQRDVLLLPVDARARAGWKLALTSAPRSRR